MNRIGFASLACYLSTTLIASRQGSTGRGINNRNSSSLSSPFGLLRRLFAQKSLIVLGLGVSCRHSRISSFKGDGYYRIERPRDVSIDETWFTMSTARGGGPGGQGSNSSSNKVELRVSMSSLSEHFDEELIGRIKQNEHGKSLTSDMTQLILSSHEHRSLHQNKEECLSRLQAIIHKASWVPPVENPPTKMPSSVVSARKMERRKKSVVKKMRQAARKGQW
uniref:Uncharacterized protein TCIL3000_6_2000 n=1 Tax=Trypanosoma congolense (strain IL3000) TaxID=1068625 RepID=G0UNK5_TRYCI|nr:unnamed protein product [Trypanosoma congolense IL3000]